MVSSIISGQLFLSGCIYYRLCRGCSMNIIIQNNSIKQQLRSIFLQPVQMFQNIVRYEKIVQGNNVLPSRGACVDSGITAGESMKKVTPNHPEMSVFSFFALIAMGGLLSGCAVVGPLLSLGGLAGFAPLQYAATAYTIGEYTYEYAANDNTPDEVLGHKIDSVVSGEAFTLPAYMQSEPAGPKTPVMVAEAAGPDEDPALSAAARQKRIEKLLGHRREQVERLELRRMAFLQARPRKDLSLSRTAMASSPNLFQGAMDEVSLDQLPLRIGISSPALRGLSSCRNRQYLLPHGGISWGMHFPFHLPALLQA
eukprot:TRINITY_DN34662_c0_g1_i1.p1 TRINITY_DN34662_c0_g1~~TRINITY_DN34662_c0_g1_i1.p1  ORF type:complete len:311 (-),score=35.61 TRINITY_DN34662_c0_g1_i1:205-1137(-)